MIFFTNVIFLLITFSWERKVFYPYKRKPGDFKLPVLTLTEW